MPFKTIREDTQPAMIFVLEHILIDRDEAGVEAHLEGTFPSPLLIRVTNFSPLTNAALPLKTIRWGRLIGSRFPG